MSWQRRKFKERKRISRREKKMSRIGRQREEVGMRGIGV